MSCSLLLAFLVGISDMCMSNRYEVHRYYADAVRAAGHDAVLIFRTTDTNSLRRVVRGLDLVLMTGGADVAPARYGEKNRLSWPDEKRDEFDFALMSACVAEKKPILGICRGCQLMNVFFGGTLVQDIPSQWRPPAGSAVVNHGRYPWTGAATLQTAIGQGYNAVTPVQLASYLSTIANGGTLWRPHVIGAVVDPFGNRVFERTISARGDLGVTPEMLDTIRSGMFQVVNSGDGSGRIHGGRISADPPGAFPGSR